MFFLLLLRQAIGQEPGMWHLTDEDGLPSMTVYQTIQDNKGFVWIGTEKGICRFDGKEYRYYDSPDLSDREILKLAVDKYDRIWFINLSGQLFYIENERVLKASALLEIPSFLVTDFVIEEEVIWLTLKNGKEYRSGYFSFAGRTEFELLKLHDNISDHIYPLLFDGEFNYHIKRVKYSDSLLLSKLIKETGEVIPVMGLLVEKGRQLKKAYFYKKQLLLSIRDVLFKVDEKRDLSRISDQVNPIQDIKIIKDSIWMMTVKGVSIYPAFDIQKRNESNLLQNISANHLMVDHEGNKWIATTGHGVYVITAPQTKVFKRNNSTLPSDEVYSLAYDTLKKRVIIGQDNGIISVMDETYNNQIVHLKNPGRTLDIMIDSEAQYWCSNDAGLYKIDNRLYSKGFLKSAVKYSIETQNKDIYFCTYAGVLKIDKSHVDNYLLPEEKHEVLREKSYSLLEDYDGVVWIGTINGIYQYFDDKLVPLLVGEKKVKYNIATMVQTSDSIVWIGTRGEGLLGIRNNKTIYHLKKSDKLASNTIKALSADDFALWIGTDNGLNRYDLQTQEWEWINTADCLPSLEVNAVKVVGEEVWVGTSKGLVNFSTKAKHTNFTPPPIYISRIQLEDKDTTVQDSFYLPYHQNSIQIDFVGLGFRGKGDITYKYKLSPEDENWVNTKSRYVRYPNLRPGDYHFEVYAVNEDQIKSKDSATIFFSIRPPWWELWWVRLLGALFIFSVISYFINARIQKQNRERMFTAQINELKTKALRAQMNPHFIFNALNAIQQFLTTNNQEQAMHYLAQFGKLIRTIFEQSQKEKISLEEELDFLNIYLELEKLRFLDMVEIRLDVSEELLEISDEINIPPLLIQSIIENSFKHGFLYKKELGILSIEFFKDENYLICTIEDNGIGRKKAAELGQQILRDRSSSGLQVAEERLLIHNKKQQNCLPRGIVITDLQGTNGVVLGTRVRVDIYCGE